jgi:site-specific DNA-methyltransferase (adenine-specific)
MKIDINKIYNKDCLVIMSKIENESIDLIATDPPYKMTARGNSGTTGGMLTKSINKKGDVFKHNNIKPKDYIPEFYRILKNGTHCYIMTNHINLIEILNVATECGFHFVKSLIWDKTNKIMGRYYMSQFEYILFFRKGSDKQINKCGTPDILRVANKKMPNKDGGGNLHDTEKPIELMKILIENSSKEGEIVLDPFAGIGSTILASIDTNRKFIGIELDKDYYETILYRIGDISKPMIKGTLFN